MWFKKQTAKTVGNALSNEGTKSFGRQIPSETARKTMRTFLPVLAVGVMAALPAHAKQQARNVLQHTINHADYTTPAPTHAGFYEVDHDKLSRDISTTIRASGFPPYLVPQQHINNQAEFTAQFLEKGSAQALRYNLPDQTEYDRFCIDISNPAHIDSLDAIEGLSRVKNLRPKEGVMGSRDYRQFVEEHEHAHCQTPWEVEIWASESMSDIYGVAKHYQQSGDIAFAENLSDLRNIGSLRYKTTTHYTSPALNAAIPVLEELHETGQLQEMSDEELLEFSESVVLDRNTHLPHAHLAEAVHERDSVLKDAGARLLVLENGETYDFLPDAGDLPPELQKAKASLEASVNNIYHVEDRLLPQEQQAALLEGYYHQNLTEFVENHEDSELAREGLAYKTWAAKREARTLSSSVLPNFNQAILSPETKLNIIEAVRQEHIPEQNPEHRPDQAHILDRS